MSAIALTMAIRRAKSRSLVSQSVRKIFQMAHIGERVREDELVSLSIVLTHSIAQKIKADLIQKAKIKKDYAKLKRNANNLDEHQDRLPEPATKDEAHEEYDARPRPTKPQPTHPDRQAMMDSSPVPETSEERSSRKDPRERNRKLKHQPFQAQYTAAQKRKEEAEARRKEREEAIRQREAKLEERERFRKAMAKARTGGRNGQRKLGRESKVLLERVKKMTSAP